MYIYIYIYILWVRAGDEQAGAARSPRRTVGMGGRLLVGMAGAPCSPSCLRQLVSSLLRAGSSFLPPTLRSISEISSCFFGPRPWHIEIRHRVKQIHT